MSEKEGGFKGRGGRSDRPSKGGFGRSDDRRPSSRGSFGDRPPPRGDRPYKPREDRGSGGDRPYKPRENRSFGDRPAPRGDRPYEKRSFGDKPRGDRPYKPREDRGSGGDRPYKPREERSFGDRPQRSDRPYEKRSFGDKPRGDRPYKPREDRGSGGDRPYKPREERSFGDRPAPRGDRPYEKRSFSDKPRGDRPYKPREDRGSGGDRPPYKPREERSFGDRPAPRGPRDDAPYKKREDWKERPVRRDSFEEKPRENREGKLEMPGTGDRPSLGAPSPLFLYGVHAVNAAWMNPERKVIRLIATESGMRLLEESVKKADIHNIKRPPPRIVEREDLERILPRDAVHQGLMLECEPLEDVFLQDILISASADNTIILVLDQVTDPHNIGAIMRSGAAFGAAAVVVQKIHAPEITGTLAKAASGAIEQIPLVREVNIARALEQMKAEGFQCIGLDEAGKETLAQARKPGKIALVLGAEGDGIRRLVAETCDTLAKLPTSGPIGSLNVSNAAAVSLYELRRS